MSSPSTWRSRRWRNARHLTPSSGSLGAPCTPRGAVPLPAAVYRDHLARIRATVRVEHISESAHRRERLIGEDEMHVLELVEADAVFAGDGTARVHTRGHDLPHRRMNARLLVGIVGVVADIRVQV